MWSLLSAQAWMDHTSSRMPDMPLVIYGQFVGGTGQGTLVSKSIQGLIFSLRDRAYCLIPGLMSWAMTTKKEVQATYKFILPGRKLHVPMWSQNMAPSYLAAGAMLPPSQHYQVLGSVKAQLQIYGPVSPAVSFSGASGMGHGHGAYGRWQWARTKRNHQPPTDNDLNGGSKICRGHSRSRASNQV